MDNVVWKPHPGSQVLFLSCPYFEVLYEGTRGPGKTDALLMDFAQHVGQGYGAAWRGILFREEFPQLADVIAKSKKWFYQMFPGVRYNNTAHKWIWPSGEELHLRFMARPDDYWNYHGHEYPWIGWEEITNWPSPDCYESMKACCRSSDPHVPRKYRATCNPYGKGHNWVKAYFVDPAPPGEPIANERGLVRCRIHGRLSENISLIAADPEYVHRLESVSDPMKRRAWLEGDWDITIGGMFDDLWRRNIHVMKPFRIPKGWRIDRSFDWGSAKPFSVGWWAEADGSPLPDGRRLARGSIIRIAEWYGAERGIDGKVIPNTGLKISAKDIALGILKREKELQAGLANGNQVRPGPADPSIWDGSQGKSIADQIAEHGVHFNPADNKDRVARWERCRQLLQNAVVNAAELPGMFVFETCTDGFLRTFPTAQRNTKNPDDLDTDQEDHCADEVGYRVMDGRSRISVQRFAL